VSNGVRPEGPADARREPKRHGSAEPRRLRHHRAVLREDLNDLHGVLAARERDLGERVEAHRAFTHVEGAGLRGGESANQRVHLAIRLGPRHLVHRDAGEAEERSKRDGPFEREAPRDSALRFTGRP
jgi:hypothetical protein